MAPLIVTLPVGSCVSSEFGTKTGALLRQYLYFCTSQASKLSMRST